MTKYDIYLSQKLDDGDTALCEEHRAVDEYYVQDIISEYIKRASSHSYVTECNIKVKMN